MDDLGIAVVSEPRRSSFLLWSKALVTGFALVTLVVATTSCSREPVHTAIVADFPGQLAALTEWNIINAGIPGDMARDAGPRLGPLLAEHQPTAVLVELGGNDFLRQRSEPSVKEDLRGILRAVEGAGAVPILVAVPRFSMLRATVGALSDSTLYAELAEEEGVPLIPGVLSSVLSDESLRADPIHPNAAGYERLASGIANELVSLGLLN